MAVLMAVIIFDGRDFQHADVKVKVKVRVMWMKREVEVGRQERRTFLIRGEKLETVEKKAQFSSQSVTWSWPERPFTFLFLFLLCTKEHAPGVAASGWVILCKQAKEAVITKAVIATFTIRQLVSTSHPWNSGTTNHLGTHT